MSLAERLDDLRQRFDARTRRERLLLGATALVALLLIWEFALRAPLYNDWARAERQARQVRGEVEQLRTSADQLEQQIRELRSGAAESPVERARERIAALDRELERRTQEVIAPDQMVAVLREMVRADEALTLVRLRNRGVEPLIEESVPATGGESGQGETAGPADAQREAIPRVYAHSVELVVTGEFFALQSYLQRLEGLEWRFQWNGLELETVDYPRLRLRIRLATLSLAEDWIGV